MMSEYIEITAESGEEPGMLHFSTNVRLSEGPAERYDWRADLEEGSPLAQALAHIPGIRRLHLQGGEMVVWHEPELPQHVLIADISAAVRDFFL
jgi:hypothetical protein